MMNNLRKLFRKFVANTASNQEVDELMKLIEDPSNKAEVEQLTDDLFARPRKEGEGLTDAEVTSTIQTILKRGKQSQKKAPVKTVLMMTAITLTIVAGVLLTYMRTTIDQDLLAQPETTTFNKKDLYHLPDGTTALLNEGSELSYSFTENGREVTLKGEAYFDVAHDPSKPFIVHTGKISTRVLGTAFNVKAYTGQNEILVTVTRGKVQVSNDKQTYLLTPNEQLAVNTVTDNFVKTDLDAEKVLTWKNQFLILDDVTMEKAASLISARYGVTITFINPAVKKCDINARFFNDEDLTDVMDMLSTAVSFKYSIGKDGSVAIDGEGCD
jgi:transmembrane sensor